MFLRTTTAAVLGALACVTAPVWAQTASGSYPAKPVRLIVPFAPGGGTDFTTRAIAQKLSDRLGGPFIVDNRAGANGTVGVDIAAKASADGYTLATISNSHTVNVSIYRKLPYDLLKDLVPIIGFSTQPFSLVIHPALPVKSVKDLIALARAKPGTLNYGSSGQGGISHLSGAMLATTAGIELGHVAYKGGTPAMIDVMSGQIQMLFSTLLQANPHIRTGRLRVLAVTTAQRNASAPELPTMIESGVPGFEVSQWFGLVAPARTPPAIIARLNAEIARIVREPDLAARLAAEGADPMVGTPEQFGAHIRGEVAKWAKLVKQIGLQPE